MYENIPMDADIYPTKMVYTTKRDPTTNEFLLAKARLVVIGCALNKVFENVFTPTTNERAMKLLFAIAVALNMDVNTVDIKGAFLYAKQRRECISCCQRN
jgi:hypothetical protein